MFGLNISGWKLVYSKVDTDRAVPVGAQSRALFLCLGSRPDFTALYLSCECGRLPLILL